MKTFKQHLKEANLYSINIDGNKKLNKVETINFQHSNLQKSLGFSELVSVNDSFHNVYKKSKNYISRTGKNDKYSNNRIRDLIVKQTEMEYPVVDVDEEGNIEFKNGSHRYQFFEVLKMNKKVAMTEQSKKNCKKHNFY